MRSEKLSNQESKRDRSPKINQLGTQNEIDSYKNLIATFLKAQQDLAHIIQDQPQDPFPLDQTMMIPSFCLKTPAYY